MLKKENRTLDLDNFVFTLCLDSLEVLNHEAKNYTIRILNSSIVKTRIEPIIINPKKFECSIY